MSYTRKTVSAPIAPASDPGEAHKSAPAGISTTKASDAPGPHHVRLHRFDAARGLGVERVIGRGTVRS